VRPVLQWVFFDERLRNLRSALKPLLQKALGERQYQALHYYAFTNFYPQAGYTEGYYASIDEANRHCYALLAQTLTAEFHPVALVDVGCGSGAISEAFQDAGCPTIHCFDNSDAALQSARGRGLTSVTKLDLTKIEKLPVSGDLCICFEVAEHLPAAYAKRLCRLLAEAAPIVALTAAPPGQGGHLHVNEQPREYWIQLMESHGMRHDNQTLARIREAFAGRMIPDYDRNLMIFRRNPTPARSIGCRG
jgi:SAM-dependent methyltransferase